MLNENYLRSSALLQQFTGLDYDYLNAIDSIQTPTLVTHGNNDVIQLEADREPTSCLINAKMVLLESGHFSFVELQSHYLHKVGIFSETVN